MIINKKHLLTMVGTYYTRITKLTSKYYNGCIYAAHTVRITNSTEQVLIGTSVYII